MHDEKRAARAIDFVELLHLASAGFKGQPFKLQDWQKNLLSEFYGEVAQDDLGPYRQYQYLYLEIQKKNGKTELIAGLGI